MTEYATELVAIDTLRPHPRNYRSHPPDQIEHLKASIQKHGIYRNVVIARDNTILAGHGVTLAVAALGWTELPVYRLDIAPDSIQALQILTGDNELDHLGMPDDRALTELLREIGSSDPLALLGTGYDELMLANLLQVTRPASEITTLDQAKEWVGMPDYQPGIIPVKLVINFRSEADRLTFVEQTKVEVSRRGGVNWTTWFPPRPDDDLASVEFTG